MEKTRFFSIRERIQERIERIVYFYGIARGQRYNRPENIPLYLLWGSQAILPVSRRSTRFQNPCASTSRFIMAPDRGRRDGGVSPCHRVIDQFLFGKAGQQSGKKNAFSASVNESKSGLSE
jgi:hypothetical protein